MSDLGPCVRWDGPVDPKTGYGYMFGPSPTRRLLIHRWLTNAPRGMEVDHVCRNRLCIRRSHLEVVTPKENRRRQGAAVTHCPRGHVYDEANTRFDRRGHRKCRACHRAWESARKRAA